MDVRQCGDQHLVSTPSSSAQQRAGAGPDEADGAMMPLWGLAILVFGVNFTLWGMVGLLRLLDHFIAWVRSNRTARRGGQSAPATETIEGDQAVPGAGRVPAFGGMQSPAALSDAQLGTAMACASGESAQPTLAEVLAKLAEELRAIPAVSGGALSQSVPAPPTVPPAEAPTEPLPALPALPASSSNVIVMRDESSRRLSQRGRLTVSDVAVLMPAHNEAVVLEDSLKAVLELVPAENVHVVSDGSTDNTYEIAVKAGVEAIKTRHNVGKAGALQEAIQHFKLVERFPVIMLLDADTRVRPGYFDAALPLFDDPRVVAVAGCVKTSPERKMSDTGHLLVAHRQRIYAIGQRVLKFGQTWLRVNATHIVPGFASLYRTNVLPKIEMNPPGLVIEDFNMTFEVYQKRLGKVGFTLSAVAVTQDPDNLRDYIRQTKRWALGLWQTARRHPPRANLFSAMLALLLLELITGSLLFLMLPVVLLILLLPYLDAGALSWPGFATVHTVISAHMNLRSVLLGIGLPDYAMTLLATGIERRPRLLLYGFMFPVMRVLDAAIAIYTMPLAWLPNSSGKWKSPARRGTPAPSKQRASSELPSMCAASAELLPDSPDRTQAG
ncbi:MAG: glycosyltransferase family 2 protein [Micromonosporaceae bacterium]